MIARGKGQLRHRFWGDYSAAVGIRFESEEQAEFALGVLGAPWQRANAHRDALLCTVDSAGLDILKLRLAKYGADASKIDSLAKSVDYGEPFAVEITE